MKNLRISFVVAMLAMVTVASAQMSLGIKGGLNMSNFAYDDEKTDKNLKLGFHVGLAADYEFMPGMALQSGLFLSTKGFKAKNETLNSEYTENLMYLQLPVHVAYKIEVTPGTKVFFHAGPYAAYGIGGKRSASAGNLSGEWDVDKIFGDGVKQYKAFDAGLGLGAGLELGQFLVDIGWDMGLMNISNVDNTSIKNQNAYLSVGYKF